MFFVPPPKPNSVLVQAYFNDYGFRALEDIFCSLVLKLFGRPEFPGYPSIPPKSLCVTPVILYCRTTLEKWARS